MTPVSVDFETYYSKKLKYGVKTMIPEQYCGHDLFHAYMVSVSDGRTSWSGALKDFTWSAIDGHPLLSHNARFDRVVYNELVKRKLAPQISYPSWHCTANLTSYLCNRRSLVQSVEKLCQVRLDKQVRADAADKHWPADFSPDEQTAMLKYAKEDANWCWKLWNDFSGKWPALEQRLSDLTISQGMRGVQINVELLNQYLCQSHEMLQNTEKEIPWLRDAEDDNDDWAEFTTKPTATKCIAEQCRRLKIPCAPVKSKDEEAYEIWETTYGPQHAWIYAVGAWRSINKLYKTFLTVKDRLRADDTLPFSTKYFGAHTGRWSGDARVNMQNMRKVPVFCNERGLLEQNEKRIADAADEHDETGHWPAWVRYAIDFRALVIPRPGKKMIVSDLSQIEPRVLAWLVGDTQLLDYVRSGKSIYEAHARATMGHTGDRLDKNSTTYKLAKARVLGLGFGCGWEKFISMAYALARLDITSEDPEWIEESNPFTEEVKKVSGYGHTSKKVVADFRSQNARTVALWRKLDDSFKRSIGSDFTLTLPSGRQMKYCDVRSSVQIKPDPITKKPKRSWVFTADSDGRRKASYGGKLCENLVQATARDVFAEHIVRLEDRGFPNLFSVHDEAVLEVDQDVTAADVEHEMSYCPDWLAGCPIAAEAKEVSHYLK